MAAAYENLSLGWRRSSMDIGVLRQRQSSSVILRYFPSATKTAMNMKLRCRSAATEEEAAANADIFSVTPSSMADFDYLGQSTKGDLNLNLAINGEAGLDGPIEDVAKMEAQEAERLFNHLGIPAWEGRAYDYCMDNLRNMGFPGDGLACDPDLERLANRGFEVMRLNTYTTEPVSQVDQMVLDLALVAPVIAVASPSAIRAWVSLTPEGQQWDNVVACIGETTALVAKKYGLKNIFFPANPGIEGWVDSIMEALQVQNQLQEV